MEVASGQSSPPPKTQQEPFDDKTESPILPPQQLKSTDAVRPPSPEKMEEVHLPQPKTQASRTQVKTPEPRNPKERIGNQKDFAERSPSTPGHLAPFDWDDFEARYQQALTEADEEEKALLIEFHSLVKYFAVWTSAASSHDTERAAKRLQTRERYVKIAEQSLSQKKKHCKLRPFDISGSANDCPVTEVVRAFQSALALLSQS